MRITAMTMPDTSAPLSALVDAAVAVAEAGFDTVWLPQLPTMPGTAAWDPLTVLALAGQRAPRVRLGTAVTIAYPQHPLALARQALTTSAAVGDRLVLGIGVSHPSIVEALGYDYDRPAAFLREYLDVLLPALEGAPVEHHGPRITAVGQVEAPGAPTPSVMVAALGPVMLDLAGSRTDGTITTWTGPRTLAGHIVPRITAAAEAAGRPRPQVIAGLPVVVTTDVDSVRAQLAEAFTFAGQAPAYRAILDREGVDGPADVSIVGDEDAVVAELRRFADAGATEFAGIALGNAQTVARTTQLLTSLAA